MDEPLTPFAYTVLGDCGDVSGLLWLACGRTLREAVDRAVLTPDVRAVRVLAHFHAGNLSRLSTAPDQSVPLDLWGQKQGRFPFTWIELKSPQEVPDHWTPTERAMKDRRF